MILHDLAQLGSTNLDMLQRACTTYTIGVMVSSWKQTSQSTIDLEWMMWIFRNHGDRRQDTASASVWCLPAIRWVLSRRLPTSPHLAQCDSRVIELPIRNPQAINYGIMTLWQTTLCPVVNLKPSNNIGSNHILLHQHYQTQINAHHRYKRIRKYQTHPKGTLPQTANILL